MITKFTSATFKVTAIAVFTCISGMAAAAGSNTLTVNASVTSKCTFNATTSTLNFGAIDPSTAGPANATQASLLYKCTKGTTGVTIAPSAGGLSRTLTSTTTPANTMAYTLVIGSTTAVTGLGFASTGTDLTTTLDASIAATAYQNAPAETYKEVVTLNINP